MEFGLNEARNRRTGVNRSGQQFRTDYFPSLAGSDERRSASTLRQRREQRPRQTRGLYAAPRVHGSSSPAAVGVVYINRGQLRYVAARPPASADTITQSVHSSRRSVDHPRRHRHQPTARKQDDEKPPSHKNVPKKF